MEKYGIDYAKMNTVRGGSVKPADLSWTAEEAHTFYDIIRGGERIATTQVPPEEFDAVFRKHLDAGEDVIYVSCSNKQSGSIFTAEKQAETLKNEYPDAKIECIDSLHASAGEGIVAMNTAAFAEEGHTFEEVAAFAKETVRTTHQFCTVHSLDYLKRAGRVKASAAFFGNLMGVKPVIIANTSGEQSPVTKVKGRMNSFKTIVSLLKTALDTGDPGDAAKKTVYIAHADCQAAEVEMLKQLVSEEISGAEIVTLIIGPIIGASVGPDAVAVFGVGRPVKDNGYVSDN